MHDHEATCAHTLKACDRCDVAYCTKCKRQWDGVCRLNHFPTQQWYPYTFTLPTITVPQTTFSVRT